MNKKQPKQNLNRRISDRYLVKYWNLPEELRTRAIELEQKSQQKRSTFEKIFYLLNIAVVFISLGLSIKSLLIQAISKQIVFEQLRTPVRNGAAISTLKDILNSSLEYQTKVFPSSTSNYFRSAPVEIETVLKELLAAEYRKASLDKALVRQLETLITENRLTSPFQGLEKQQTYLFNNVRIKSVDYEKISTDMEKLAEEIRSKNLLVAKYLSDSNYSFWISILALIFSVGIGIFQIYQAETGKKDQKAMSQTILSLLQPKKPPKGQSLQ